MFIGKIIRSFIDLPFSKNKLIWYKRDSEILNQNDRVKSYKIQLFFENGKSIKDRIILPINI